jgi:pimeloyl-ACP methyl ester carboxylesterase
MKRMHKIVLPVLSLMILFSCTNMDKEISPAEAKVKKVEPDSTGGYAPVNGLNMYYEIHGDGRPLVLIHGGGSTIQTTFGTILPLLAQRHKVIAVELQAHGHTSDRDSAESFSQDAGDVAALLAYLKIDKADFLGFSNGGQTSIQIGISYPQIVNKLVIVSAFYERDGTIKGFFEGLQNANLGNMPEPLRQAYLEIKNDSAGLKRMFEKDRARMVQFTGWKDEDLASIKAPALIIAGDKDIVTPEHSVKMSKVIPNAELMIVPGSHGSFIGEVCTAIKGSKLPELTVATIEEFLRK